jgi:2,5-diketo-D-gluconate reductase B
MIPKIELASNKEIPILGLGTYKLTGLKCIDAIKSALKIGYTHIDTAEYYENETEIGVAIKSINRSKLFLTSKVKPSNLKYDDVINACKKSLNKLETKYLDLYLIHWPNFQIPLTETFKAFEYLVNIGMVKSIGISNFTTKLVTEAIKASKLPIVTNQIEFHALLYQKKLLEYCIQNNIFITAYCPIARGKVNDNNILVDLSVKYNKTPIQISLRWLIQKKIIVIPKASSLNHLEENFNIFDFEIDINDINKIDSIGEQLRLVSLGF